ncbi:MAG: tetratricopeptide repeat protein [Spirochaetales bacterium]|nr:tetratricopeptide repeat protein [Spirochaetales bacterium]
MKQYILFTVTILCLLLPVYSQDNASNVFAPFVSRIHTEQKNDSIILTWKNSEDLTGSKKIYRFREEITDTNLKQAEMIARVGKDVQSFTDQPQKGSPVFYAVLLEDEKGSVYEILIPYRNKTTVPMTISTAVPTESFAEISNIQSTVSGQMVIVSFSNANKNRDIVLYRSTKPIISTQDLAETEFSVSLPGDTTSYTDTVIAGVDYYYTIVDAEKSRTGKAEIESGKNTTIAPVSVAVAETPVHENVFVSRTFPLPAPHIIFGVESGDTLLPPIPFLLPPKSSLSKDSSDRVNALISRLHFNSTSLSPEILPEESADNLEGENKELSAIISNMLLKFRYTEAEKALTEFLSKEHDASLTARIHFYRGQAYYHLAQYQDALIDFILAEDAYYQQSQRWIDECFHKLNFENN